MSTSPVALINLTNVTDGADGWEDDEAKLLRLLEKDGVGLAIDITILAIVLITTILCIWKRPKTFGVLIVCWIAWFVIVVVKEHSRRHDLQQDLQHVWKDIRANEQEVHTQTRTLVYNLWRFLISWVVLIAPLALVLARVFQRFWNETPEQRRPIFVLAAVGFVGVLLFVRSIVRHRDSITRAGGAIIFQLTFVAVGPLVYFLMLRVSLEVAPWILFAFMSVIPTLWSIFLLRWFRTETQERDRLGRSDIIKVTDMLRARTSPAKEDQSIFRILKWIFGQLSYWSCWPFFHVAESVIQMKSIKESSRTQAYGVLLALVFWSQFWGASRMMPLLIRYLTRCYKSLRRNVQNWRENRAKTREKTRDSSVEAQTTATLSTKERLLQATRSLPIAARCADFIERNYNYLVAGFICLAIVVIAMSFFLPVAGIISSLVSLIFLFVVGFDCAGRVEWKDATMAPSRIGFWIVAMVWLWLFHIPIIGSFCKKIALLVFVAAYLAGETVARIVVGSASFICGWCCDVLIQRFRPKRESHAQADDGDVELTDVHDDKGPAPPSFQEADAGLVRGDSNRRLRVNEAVPPQKKALNDFESW